MAVILSIAMILKMDSRDSVGSFGGVRIDPERSVNCDGIHMEPNGPYQVYLVARDP